MRAAVGSFFLCFSLNSPSELMPKSVTQLLTLEVCDLFNLSCPKGTNLILRNQNDLTCIKRNECIYQVITIRTI